MAFLRLNTGTMTGLKIFFCEVILLSGVFFFSESLYAEKGGIAPDKTITVVAGQPDIPKWKILWDKGREEVRANRFLTASKFYNDLLKIKPNIEEANWEFCQILLKNEDFSSAEKIIVSLVENDPLRIEYLLTAGGITLRQKNYTLAIRYYGKVYELDPGGSHSTAALEGLIDSLKGKGKHENVLPLLEQLYVREPENVTRLHELAREARSLGKFTKAKIYYSKLLEMGPVDDRILFQASELFDDTIDKERVVPLWQEYVRRNPNYLPFRQKLVEFYLGKGEGLAALPHLLVINNKVLDNNALQLQIAEIYLHDGGRPDKALSYYEKYLLKNPGDQSVKFQISYIQSILANDYLSIVENDGAWQLWRDLMEVTPDPLGIYLEMVSLLERKGKSEELLEILLIIAEHKPQDDEVNYKIVNLYRQKKEYGRALHYLGKITVSHNSTKKHFLLKGNIEELAGFEQDALASYSKSLEKDNTDLSLRKDCITRAGSLGMVNELEGFFIDNQISNYNRNHIDFILNYCDQLSYNFLFSRLDEVYDYFLDVFNSNQPIMSKLQLHRAHTLRKQGKPRKAEELLRKLSNHKPTETEALYRLTLNAIEDRDIETSKAWYRAFENKVGTYPESKERDALQRRKAILKVKTLLATDDIQDASFLIIDLKKRATQKTDDISYNSSIYQLEKDLCWQYLENEDFSECETLLNSLQKSKKFDPELVVIHDILMKGSKRTIEPLSSSFSLVSGKYPITSRLLQVVQVELRHKEYTRARNHLDTIVNTKIDSLVSQVLLAELSFKNESIKTAVDLYKNIYHRFPGEKYLFRKWMMYESKNGNYNSGIAALLKADERLQKIDGPGDYRDLPYDFEEVLLFARMLWGSKQLEKSLRVYEFLLNPPVIDLLGEKFEFNEIYYHYFTKDKSFWNSLKYLLQTKPEIVGELMAPPYLIDNMGKESGKIVAGYYELYSWQKLIMNEYLARKAIVHRNYVTAERNYKRLLAEEEEDIEGLSDLASIYDRFGQYRKEAQVYEVMRKSGAASPEMADVIEKSSTKIRPHTGLEGGFLTKSGREGQINLENRNLGASLLFSPDLEKDITFLYLHNNYSQTEKEESQSGFLIESSGTIELLSDTDLLFSAQAERFEGKSGANFYYFIGLRSRLDDYFSSHVEAYRKKVDDTLDALVEGIYSDGFEIGLSGETPVGLLFGGDYRHRYYSDGNSQDQFHGYSSYNIYGEVVHFSVQYDYFNLENNSSNDGIPVLDTGSSEDSLYWTPNRYDGHGITVHFQHLIKGNYGSDGLKSYYSFDNSINYEDYDDTQNIIYTGRFDIFLEISPHYLLKGNLVFKNSEEYEEGSVHFSLLYRW
jgi:lipopolysaccharide biosynthesis regulator YciM